MTEAHRKHIVAAALNTTDSAAKIARQVGLPVGPVAVLVTELRAHR